MCIRDRFSGQQISWLCDEHPEGIAAFWPHTTSTRNIQPVLITYNYVHLNLLVERISERLAYLDCLLMMIIMQTVLKMESNPRIAQQQLCFQFLPDTAFLRFSLPAPVLLVCLLYTSPSPRDRTRSRMPSSA
eukprot:TRINITY_DN10928_c0_g1_i1.p1 TRINITY_DN10928_c0_g1~~TRINITY_DN10928_c0_g1_i1.p1  ORF type:complete len:132 (-),score=13.46 TRINITY_DN10928_c0_g1_i1:46-441(-)